MRPRHQPVAITAETSQQSSQPNLQDKQHNVAFRTAIRARFPIPSPRTIRRPRSQRFCPIERTPGFWGRRCDANVVRRFLRFLRPTGQVWPRLSSKTPVNQIHSTLNQALDRGRAVRDWLQLVSCPTLCCVPSVPLTYSGRRPATIRAWSGPPLLSPGPLRDAWDAITYLPLYFGH